MARLQQLQAAAAQWQHVQQQRAGMQYQALMQQHEKLQNILEKYQQFIQQPANLQVEASFFCYVFEALWRQSLFKHQVQVCIIAKRHKLSGFHFGDVAHRTEQGRQQI